MNLEGIQSELQRLGLDGWLFFDHHLRDPLAYRVLGLPIAGHVSRRWYYFIPARGEPRGLVHRVEPHQLDPLPGDKQLYARWQEQEPALRRLLDGARTVAMQYSPHCAVPYVAHVDAGTVELIRSLGTEVVSSAELIQTFEAKWSPAQLELHLEAGRHVDRIREEAFDFIGTATRNGTAIDEYAVQQFVMRRFAESGMVTNHPPIVGANVNAADSHYCPPETGSAPIRRGDLVLLDLWAKIDVPDGVYYDITWMAFCGDEVPAPMREAFATVVAARDTGIRLVQEAMAAGRTLRGFEVDDAVRGCIESRGMGAFIRHRTGHSIGREVHGVGANIDNYETHDDRRIIPWTCFSIEPALYLPDFGVRTEINLFVEERGARVTGRIQNEFVTL
ncbi:MAG: aminopeptidase P family protein [Verrucomicrobiales bacterium]|nr:aminopeptidase P family protein [Verrucomicrobiales bacterium]